MTIKEIIKKGNEKFPQDIIEIINDDGSITRKDVNFKVRKAYIQGLIDNNVNLPSNIDDAAEEWARQEVSMVNQVNLPYLFLVHLVSNLVQSGWHSQLPKRRRRNPFVKPTN